MHKDTTPDEEEDKMDGMRRLFKSVERVRLGLLEIGRWTDSRSAEYDLAAEEIACAIDALFRTEDAISNAHKHMLLASVAAGHDGIFKADDA